MKKLVQLSLVASLSIINFAGQFAHAQESDTTALQDQAQKVPSKAKLLRTVLSLQVTVSLKLDEIGIEPTGNEAEITSGLLDHAVDLESLVAEIKKTDDNDKVALVELGKQIKISHQSIMSLIRSAAK